ncbi:GNAT family N-acetyltransferase [Shouchella shacheensis]|uniref:GNAT family N-acetyltransferase n=1 Tax=Shouchella shacheensis TaxID=1649580 RepID=UPI000A5548C8|nr:GNAT family protein [Shouchella shacheensis]
MIIRTIEKKDAELFLRLQRQLDEETAFMLYEPGERKTTVRGQRKIIRNVLLSTNSTIIVAENRAGRLVGYIGIFGSQLTRIRHVGYITIGILNACCNQGLGRMFLAHGEQFAKSVCISRLELTVMAENRRAIHLYHKVGFQEEGRRERSLYVNGKWEDELYMAKLID